MGVITIGIDPEIQLGPVTLAWHGLTIVIGVAVAAWAASRWARVRGVDPEPLFALTMLLAVAAMVGARLFYLVEHGGPVLGTRGFTFDGGFIAAGLALVAYATVTRLDLRLLDIVALWLPVGVAIGRVGDVINGEHYGDPSTGLLAVRNSHPDALTPNSTLAYENGGLYEVMLALVIFALAWSVRDKLPRIGDVAWLVTALFAVGRFVVFLFRSDSPELAMGLSNAQWTSVVLLLVVVIGRTLVKAPLRPNFEVPPGR